MDAHLTVGVLGGMGPAATADFMRTVIRLTPAAEDQDHIHMLIDSDPTVPDRTPYLFGEGASPLPKLLRMARGLEGSGANFLVMPCNTAHAFHTELAEAVGIPVLNMIELAVVEVVELLSRREPVAAITTSGTLRTGLYQEAVRRAADEELILPAAGEQEAIQAAIYQVKRGEVGPAVRTLSPVIASLEERGARAFLLGCTEVPLITKAGFPDLPVVNATECLARETVRRALGLDAAPPILSPEIANEAANEA